MEDSQNNRDRKRKRKDEGRRKSGADRDRGMAERPHVSMKEDSSYLYVTELGIHPRNSVYLHNLRAKVKKELRNILYMQPLFIAIKVRTRTT